MAAPNPHQTPDSGFTQVLKQTAKELREAQKASNRAFNAARRGVSQLQTKILSTPDVGSRPRFRMPTGASGGAAAAKKPTPRKPKKTHFATPRPRANALSVKPAKPKPKVKAVSKLDANPKPKLKPKPKPKVKVVSKLDADPKPKHVDTCSGSSGDDGSSIFFESTGMTPPNTPPNTPPKPASPPASTFEDTFKAMDEASPSLREERARSKTPANTPVVAGASSSTVNGAAAAAAKKKSPTKACPSCGAEIPTACRRCPHCGASALKQDQRSIRERKRRLETVNGGTAKKVKTDSAHL